MTFIFRNRTIFWDISKWNRGQKKWDGGSTIFYLLLTVCYIIVKTITIYYICGLVLILVWDGFPVSLNWFWIGFPNGFGLFLSWISQWVLIDFELGFLVGLAWFWFGLILSWVFWSVDFGSTLWWIIKCSNDLCWCWLGGGGGATRLVVILGFFLLLLMFCWVVVNIGMK